MGDLPELVLGNELEAEVQRLTNDPAVAQMSPALPQDNTLSITNLTQEEQKAVRDFAERINISDQTVVMAYGSAAQTKIAKFSDDVLQSVKAKDLGPAGKSLAELVVEIKSFDATGEEKKTGLAALFGKGNAIKKNIDKMMAGYDNASASIDSIVSTLEGHKRSLMKDIAMMDEMYKNNHEYFREVTMYIIAGDEKLKEYRAVDIPRQRELAEKEHSEMATQQLNDMVNLAERFEKKLHDLKLTRMISIQMAPQIRMLQNNDMLLTEKIQSSINNAIPLWKNQMVISLGLANGQAALEAQKKVTDMTNELLVKNSELLKQSTLEVARASEESIVSLDAVRKTNENLITTINEVLDIQKKGSENRAIAENELQKLEVDLKNTLFQASNR
ncbi:MAG: toxic anion resistance protein [Clostridiales bacterium]|nr:toxic anion resistance protein [Clostridiales bacterium]